MENTGGGTKKPRTRKKPQTQTGKVKIEYKKPNDTKTVLSACALHKNHLLDLLEDLSEVSSFDHAEVIAEQVKEEVDRKISHLRSAQDEEQTEEKEEEAVE